MPCTLVSGVNDGYIVTQVVYGIYILIMDVLAGIQMYRYIQLRRHTAGTLSSRIPPKPAGVPLSPTNDVQIVTVQVQPAPRDHSTSSSSNDSTSSGHRIPLTSRWIMYIIWEACLVQTIKSIDPRHIWSILPSAMLYFIETLITANGIQVMALTIFTLLTVASNTVGLQIPAWIRHALLLIGVSITLLVIAVTAAVYASNQFEWSAVFLFGAGICGTIEAALLNYGAWRLRQLMRVIDRRQQAAAVNKPEGKAKQLPLATSHNARAPPHALSPTRSNTIDRSFDIPLAARVSNAVSQSQQTPAAASSASSEPTRERRMKMTMSEALRTGSVLGGHTQLQAEKYKQIRSAMRKLQRLNIIWTVILLASSILTLVFGIPRLQQSLPARFSDPQDHTDFDFDYFEMIQLIGIGVVLLFTWHTTQKRSHKVRASTQPHQHLKSDITMQTGAMTLHTAYATQAASEIGLKFENSRAVSPAHRPANAPPTNLIAPIIASPRRSGWPGNDRQPVEAVSEEVSSGSSNDDSGQPTPTLRDFDHNTPVTHLHQLVTSTDDAAPVHCVVEVGTQQKYLINDLKPTYDHVRLYSTDDGLLPSVDDVAYRQSSAEGDLNSK